MGRAARELRRRGAKAVPAPVLQASLSFDLEAVALRAGRWELRRLSDEQLDELYRGLGGRLEEPEPSPPARRVVGGRRGERAGVGGRLASSAPAAPKVEAEEQPAGAAPGRPAETSSDSGRSEEAAEEAYDYERFAPPALAWRRRGDRFDPMTYTP